MKKPKGSNKKPTLLSRCKKLLVGRVVRVEVSNHGVQVSLLDKKRLNQKRLTGVR